MGWYDNCILGIMSFQSALNIIKNNNNTVNQNKSCNHYSVSQGVSYPGYGNECNII